MYKIAITKVLAPDNVAMSHWLRNDLTEGYGAERQAEKLKALKSISAPEIAADVVGGLVGTGLGYALSRAIHRKPKAWVKALYMLAGAATGATGTHFGMQHIDAPIAGFDGKLTEYLRMKPFFEKYKGKEDEEEKRKKNKGLFKSLAPDSGDDRREVYTGISLKDAATSSSAKMGGGLGATAAGLNTLITGRGIIPDRSRETGQALKALNTRGDIPDTIKAKNWIKDNLGSDPSTQLPTEHQPLVSATVAVPSSPGSTTNVVNIGDKVHRGQPGTTEPALILRDLLPNYDQTQMGYRVPAPSAGAGITARVWHALRRFFQENYREPAPPAPGSPTPGFWARQWERINRGLRKGKGSLKNVNGLDTYNWKPGIAYRAMYAVPNAVAGYGGGYLAGAAWDAILQKLHGMTLDTNYNSWLDIENKKYKKYKKNKKK